MTRPADQPQEDAQTQPQTEDAAWLAEVAGMLQRVRQMRQGVREFHADTLILRANISDAREGDEPLDELDELDE